MDNLRGILLVIAAMVMFTIEDSFIKGLSTVFPVGQILIVLGLGGASVFAVIAYIKRQPLVGPQVFSKMLFWRSLGETGSAFFFVTALWLVPLSVAAALLQTTSLIVTIGAAFLLGETVGWRRWSAIFIGLIGVLVIIRPGFEGFEPAALLAVAAAVLLAGRDLATRRLPTGTPSVAVSFWGFFAVIPAGIILSVFLGSPIMPTLPQTGLFVACVVFGTVGYYLIVTAMRMGEASVLAPFRYTRLVFSIILGYFFFNEIPDFWTMIGAAIILSSGIYVILRERRVLESRVPPEDA
ncbi:DMT family transporter [Halocynthiibacter namhaensis]|uniref:DMT family transporter n=1 Tax=Halocynthiibacter namhaensis TaxID=1290553 RepID=UPI00057972CD|nr:DMT family transporter [Halocynthiibacter namhaensis]